jgi:hypothetical protein
MHWFRSFPMKRFLWHCRKNRSLIRMDHKTDLVVWPCGCHTWTTGSGFFIRWCGDPECRVYQIAIEESRKRGNIVVCNKPCYGRYLIPGATVCFHCDARSECQRESENRTII